VDEFSFVSKTESAEICRVGINEMDEGRSTMSATISILRSGPSAEPGWSPTAVLARLWRSVATAHRVRQTRRELHRLDERLLADAGLSRHEIDPVVEALARTFAGGSLR
jgi:uncharacterized protein YjiS (DUF1127 family)